MVWRTLAPDGSQSTKANVTILQDNTTYIEQTMGNVLSNAEPSQDHFWNLNQYSGHHRQVQMTNYAATYAGAPLEPTLNANMDGSIFVKIANDQFKGFFKNSTNTYQFIPAFVTGTHNVTGSYTNVVALPNNCYGQVWMFKTGAAESDFGFGAFRVTNSVCQAFCFPSNVGGSTSANLQLRFGSGDQASGLNFRVKADGGGTGNYAYRLIYWAT